MALGKYVKKAINVVGDVAKVGVELGADAVGVIAEKLDDDPGKKEKFKNIGMNLGENIKSGATKIADGSVDVVDNMVDTGSRICKDIGFEISQKMNDSKAKKAPNKQGDEEENNI